VLQFLIVLKIVFFMLSSEGMMIVLKPFIENVMKYKNQVVDCIGRHCNSTIVHLLLFV
jgi:hypothetical protein